MQGHALSLIHSLESIGQSNGLFLSLETIYYIHILRDVCTLSWSIIQQVGHLAECAQDAGREKIKIIKYKILPLLFGLADEIVVQGMLNPEYTLRPFWKETEFLMRPLLIDQADY